MSSNLGGDEMNLSSTNYPTDPFTISDPRNPRNNVFELQIIRLSPDYEALKLRKSQSGKCRCLRAGRVRLSMSNGASINRCKWKKVVLVFFFSFPLVSSIRV